MRSGDDAKTALGQERKSQSHLKASQSWLGALLEHSQDLVTAISADGQNLFQSPSVERVLGYHPTEVEHSDAFELLHPDDASKFRAFFDQSLKRPGVPLRIEYRMKRKDGTYALLEGIGVNLLDNPEVRAVVVNARDLSEQKLKEPTTGLASRILLLHQLARIRSAALQGETFSVLAIGVDRLHEVEASLTPDAVERLLAGVGRRFELAAGPDDMVSCIGFNTFAILTSGTGDVDGARTVALRLRRSLAMPIDVDDESITITVSIGILAGSVDTEAGPEQMLRDAELALRQAMHQGLSSTQVFGRELRDRARAKLSLETQLRDAILRDELIVHYQPILRVATRGLCGFEALVRWQKPNGELVSPGAFIPVAESAGLIRQIDLMVMRKAAKQTKEWLSLRPDLFVNVNLSARHFSDEQLPSAVQSVLKETGLPPDALKLELTETALVQNENVAARVMQSLRSAGVRFGLDDFGTGYSALSYLQQFPFDSLKIDRSFISGLGGDAANPGLVRAIIALASALRLEVVAEGVESAQELAFLEAERCEFAQGYFFSRPVPASAATVMVGAEVAS
jgi:PAS domain S-box-containing protein/diguanylate cyclase (GGDEF)-like protein